MNRDDEGRPGRGYREQQQKTPQTGRTKADREPALLAGAAVFAAVAAACGGSGDGAPETIRSGVFTPTPVGTSEPAQTATATPPPSPEVEDVASRLSFLRDLAEIHSSPLSLAFDAGAASVELAAATFDTPAGPPRQSRDGAGRSAADLYRVPGRLARGRRLARPDCRGTPCLF